MFKLYLMIIVSILKSVMNQACLNYPFQPEIPKNFIFCPDWYLLYTGEGTLEFKASGNEILVGLFSSNSEFVYAFRFSGTDLIIYERGNLNNLVKIYNSVKVNEILMNRFKIVIEKHNSSIRFFINGEQVAYYTDSSWDNELIRYSFSKFTNSNVVYYPNDPYIENFPGYPYSPLSISQVKWEFFRNDFENVNSVRKIHLRAREAGLVVGIFSEVNLNSSSKFNYAISFGEKINLYQNGNFDQIINSYNKNLNYNKFFTKFTIILDSQNRRISAVINGTNQVDFNVENLNLGENLHYSFSQLNKNVGIDYFLECKQTLPYNPRYRATNGLKWECFNDKFTVPFGEIRDFDKLIQGYDFYLIFLDDNMFQTNFFNYFFLIGATDNTQYVVLKDGDDGPHLISEKLSIPNYNNFNRFRIRFNLRDNTIKLFINGTEKFSNKIRVPINFGKDTPLYFVFAQRYENSTINNLPSEGYPSNFPYSPRNFWVNPYHEYEFFNKNWTFPQKGNGTVKFSMKGFDCYFGVYSESRTFTTNFDINLVIGGDENKKIFASFNGIINNDNSINYIIPNTDIFNEFELNYIKNNKTIIIKNNNQFVGKFVLGNWPEEIEYFTFARNKYNCEIKNISSY